MRKEKGNVFTASGRKIHHQSEIEFIKGFFNHQNWIYHPAVFKTNMFRDEPDFYDGERDMFIEVAGTSVSFYANKRKYEQFMKIFPKINFEIRRFDGLLMDINDTKQSWSDINFLKA